MTFAASLKSLRIIHRYLGLFFAPTILFFAITGGLQMFGLHETARGSSYIPPNIFVHLSQLHKKGTLYLPLSKVAPPGLAKSDEHISEFVQEPTLMPWGNRSMLFKDPDGNFVNFFTPVTTEAIQRANG